jgi:uncharacterized membrane protein (UPF0127 family)
MRRFIKYLLLLACLFPCAAGAQFFEYKKVDIFAPAAEGTTSSTSSASSSGAPPAVAKMFYRAQVFHSNHIINEVNIVMKPFPTGEAELTVLTEPEPLEIPLTSLGIARDFLFIDASGIITKIETGTPYAAQPLKADSLVSSVLQLNAGEAKTYGITPGDRVAVH